MKPRFDLDERDRALLAWIRGNWLITLRITLMSFGFTALVGALVLVVHELAQRNGDVEADLMGVSIDLSPVARAGYDLPLLVLTLAAWIGMSSLSRLLVARQVRNHLLALTPPADKPGDRFSEADAPIDSGEGEDEEAGEGGNAMAERMLLQALLGLVNSAARALMVTVVLALVVPRAVIVGMVAVWIVAALVALHRFRVGQDANDAITRLVAAQRGQRLARSNHEMVNAVYERDRALSRLTAGQVAILVGSITALVVIPVWLLGSGQGSVAALVVLLLWLQAILSTVTEAGSFGYRHANWARRLTDPRENRPAHAQRRERTTGSPRDREHVRGAMSVALVMSVPPAWPRAEVTWMRTATDQRTVVAFLDADGQIGGVNPLDLGTALAACDTGLVTLHPRGGSEGYAALGPDLPSSLSGLTQMLPMDRAVLLSAAADHTRALLTATVSRPQRTILVGSADPIDAARADFVVDAPTFRSLLFPGVLAPVLALWFDSAIPVTEMAGRTAGLVRSHAD